ncbi:MULTISPECIES: sulfurtransferase complex subunit TusC [Pseudomonas]|uniref:sulfurtransferase complex subunit TusC n=1 Tax=Pseudomonas TaxID=286 RepID=UPI00106FFCF7|nr:sulfurtransferase complex subunit TusC [Pseudomonas coleopterorum]MDY1045879.1 sulfurtransferase complex subunit TusC [Pseudomonas coleopterorum]
MAKSMLIISRQAPWAGPAAREALDIALAGGAYDLPVSMLFLDDGVYQLTDAQAPGAVQQKNLAANLQALPLFGVDELFVCAASLARRGLSDAALAIAAQTQTDEQLRELLPRFDLVVTL